MIVQKYPQLENTNHVNHLGTLGTGNHFFELCVDESNSVWIMLHSGSRGVGNRVGTLFIEQAVKDMGKLISNLPNERLAYLTEGTEYFNDYVYAVQWAQNYAQLNRECMLNNIIYRLQTLQCIPPFTLVKSAINCHHNYVEKYSISTGKSFSLNSTQNETVYLTRKGATSAKKGELAVIPGSMGDCSYIVRGLGNLNSYCSCSHGAGRKYSRGEAKRRFSIYNHEESTSNIECRKDKDILDETPLAYKYIDSVIKAQSNLVEVVYKLKQIICVKG